MGWIGTMRRTARVARALSRFDWGALLRAWVLLLAVDLVLRLVPFPQVQRFAGRLRGRSKPEEEAGAKWRMERAVVSPA